MHKLYIFLKISKYQHIYVYRCNISLHFQNAVHFNDADVNVFSNTRIFVAMILNEDFTQSVVIKIREAMTFFT